MRYALLVYNEIEVRDRTPDEKRRRIRGFIVVEAQNLDGALAVAGELQERRPAGSGGAIEIRPVREDELVGA